MSQMVSCILRVCTGVCLLLQDPFAEVQAAAAAEEAERNENMRTYERLRADYRADPVTYSENVLRSSRFLELQNGADLSLVSEPVKQILTADMRARAADLAAQNAELTNLAQVETTKKREPKQPLFGGLHPCSAALQHLSVSAELTLC